MSSSIDIKVMQANTAIILDDTYCFECQWPVVFACCNDNFRDYRDAEEWDWWMYCTNKGCKNHSGEGVFQDDPEWVVRV